MKYACLVYGEEQALHDSSEQGQKALDAAAMAYDDGLQASGHLIVAQALSSVASAKSVKIRKSRRTVIDGPFAETKEQLLGFLLIEARDMEEALEIAAKCPLAEIGLIEVRPTYDYRARHLST